MNNIKCSNLSTSKANSRSENPLLRAASDETIKNFYSCKSSTFACKFVTQVYRNYNYWKNMNFTNGSKGFSPANGCNY